MIGVDVRSNIRQVLVDFRARSEGMRDKAVMRALNRALDQTATGASRKIRERYNVKAGVVMDQMVKDKANAISLTATLHVGTRRRGRGRLGLIEFDANWTRRMAGASVKIMTGGSRKIYPHTFITTIRSGAFAGYRGVAIRRDMGPGGGRAFWFLRGLSIPQSFRHRVVLDAVKKISTESFIKNFKQQIQFLNSKAGG